jgi:uroporphyrinogen-III synthase
MSNAPRRVLVTRPEPGATETARRLKELGFVPIKLPLQEIRALPVSADAVPGKIAAVAVTSANAIRHTPGELLGKLAAFPCFAVGDTTGSIARAAGFSNVIEGRGDAESLADTVITKRPAGPVAYLCGRVRRPLFEQRLAGAGIAVVPVETYDTATIVRPADEISAALEAVPVNYALVYSANTAEALVETMRNSATEKTFKNTVFACISARVADVLAGSVRSKILVAAEPNEIALFTLLEQTVGGAS